MSSRQAPSCAPSLRTEPVTDWILLRFCFDSATHCLTATESRQAGRKQTAGNGGGMPVRARPFAAARTIARTI